MHKRICYLFFVLCLPVSAQEIVIPDPNLREAIHEALNVPFSDPITRTDVQSLRELVAKSRDIEVLTGLEAATQLEYLVLSGNRIKDIKPLANLLKLTHLALGENRISDIRPLEDLVQLRELHLTNNSVVDVSPLSNLMNLRKCHLSRNLVEDVSPLASLTALVELDIHNNPALDYSALFGIPHLTYDQPCEVEPLPVRDRIMNRSYPSIGMAWGGGNSEFFQKLNRPELTEMELIALHDLWLQGGHFGLSVKNAGNDTIVVGNMLEARDQRDQYLAINPDLIFVKTVQFRHKHLSQLPSDSPFWVRDENGSIARDGTRGYYDFTNPAVQEKILSEVRAIDRCGFYDGVFIDWWSDNSQVLGGYRTREQENHARDVILRGVRASTRTDFLILVNGGPKMLPLTGSYVNGTFMETVQPLDKAFELMSSQLDTYANTLSWSETHMRPPHINFLEGWGNPHEPADSPTNRRWMRVFTTLSLTHSDGYVLLTDGTSHQHLWYDFWDADLGRPVGEKGQLYQDIDGLYIREFTNGWAVYNHSGGAQVITLPEEVQGVASGLVNTEHALPNLDGEMYLRVKPKNPADVNGDGLVNVFDLVMVAEAF